MALVHKTTKQQAAGKKGAKKAGTKVKPTMSTKNEPNQPTPLLKAGQFVVELQPRHADWVRRQGAMYGRTVEKQIEKIVREAYAQDPERATGASAIEGTDAHKALTA
jgi:hypothetical protein